MLYRFYGKVNIGYIYRKLKMSFKGQTYWKWANGQNIYEFEKEMDPRGNSDPVLGLYMISLFKQGYWYKSQISGELLQDHCSF